MSTVHVFYSTIQSCRYVFTNGVVANFVGHKYATTHPGQIAELNQVVADGNSFIYVRKGEETADYDVMDPLAEIRKKHFEEFTALLASQTAQKTSDFGASIQGSINPTSTTDINPVAISSGKAVK